MVFKRKKIDAVTSKKSSLWKHICSAFHKIHLVDKCLLLLMLVLMTQSAYILLTNGGEAPESNHIDIIIRTASASIFGYFLSANFVQRSISSKPDIKKTGRATEMTSKSTGLNDMPQNRIGFALSESGAEPDQGNVEFTTYSMDDEKELPMGRLQIITATAIAMFCLIALILVRNIGGYNEYGNASTVAVIAQFRDFVSGCVGFLIGCPTARSRSR